MNLTTVSQLALVLLLLLPSCRKEKEREEALDGGTTIDNVRFEPVVGESWVYETITRLAPEVVSPDSNGDSTPEGKVSRTTRTRRYVGKRVPEKGAPEAHCFEIYQEGELVETEFSIFDERGISNSAFQKKGQSVFLLDPPVVLVPEGLELASSWDLKLPNPNDPSGPAMIERKFQYYGVEPLIVLGNEQKAVLMKVLGRTDQLRLQRDYWFVPRIGFVKERRSYYLEDQRVSLIEETLIEHKVPNKAKD